MNGTFDAPNAVCIAESKYAIRVRAKDLGPEPRWIPQSVIHEDSEVWKRGDSGTLIIDASFASNKGWL